MTSLESGASPGRAGRWEYKSKVPYVDNVPSRAGITRDKPSDIDYRVCAFPRSLGLSRVRLALSSRACEAERRTRQGERRRRRTPLRCLANPAFGRSYRLGSPWVAELAGAPPGTRQPNNRNPTGRGTSPPPACRPRAPPAPKTPPPGASPRVAALPGRHPPKPASPTRSPTVSGRPPAVGGGESQGVPLLASCLVRTSGRAPSPTVLRFYSTLIV